MVMTNTKLCHIYLAAIKNLDNIPVAGSGRLYRVKLDLLEFMNWHIMDMRKEGMMLLRRVNTKRSKPDGVPDEESEQVEDEMKIVPCFKEDCRSSSHSSFIPGKQAQGD